MDVDRDALVSAIGNIAEAMSDVDALRKSLDVDYADKRARIDLLIEDRRVEELDGGILRYHLITPITDQANQKIEYLTFRRPTVGTIRKASRYSGDEWAAYLIRVLSHEVADDATLDRISGEEWDAIVEVVRFPFTPRPTRRGADRPASPASSGGQS